MKNNLLTAVATGALAVAALGIVFLAGNGTAVPAGDGDLTSKEKHVIENKGTEPPFSGKYLDHKEDGVYVCKRCGVELFDSKDKFDSGSGWPSFDDAIPGAVEERPDPDGMRTEIVCANCDAHLGHVFIGEGYTQKNLRHCVNSISLEFEARGQGGSEERAYFAGGCYWGVEYYLEKAPGVISVTSGFMGGHVDNPTYKQVTTGKTGHAEVVEVLFDPSQTSFEDLTKLFLEIHDPTQVNRQGPDVGNQYRSAIFYTDANQRKTAAYLLRVLKKKGLKVATALHPAEEFWAAPDYHQDYYEKKGSLPYCHSRTPRF